ncbi:MAG: 16S rRNA (adenine(1518)-N(6)/adenine(1519)-N(6))-dimethyltransferase RsmA [Candidatus Micrarchaeaceae archaeon]
MDRQSYVSLAKEFGASKRLGQNFLLDADVAKKEAQYAIDKTVVELGPGLGILTRELCKVAKEVIAVERDTRLYDELSSTIKAKNLTLVNGDFFEVGTKTKGAEIMVANIPYNLSSKTIMWLAEHRMPALLCLQKEFVEHLLAKPDTRDYSRLSVVCSLEFKIYGIMDLSNEMFYPVPKVSSSVVFMKPTGDRIQKNVMDMIGLLMNHKKKKIRNAFADSSAALGIGKAEAFKIADRLSGAGHRAFKMEPEEILAIAEILSKELSMRRSR